MDLSGRKMRFVMLVSGAAIVMLILTWRFVQGGAASVQEGFVPVNGQMQELLNHQSEDPGAKVDKSTKRKDPMGPKSAQDTKQTTKDTRDAQNVNGANGTEGANESVDLKTQESQATNKLNINTATWEQLDKLPGIGESKAKAIIAYRGEKGNFRKIEDLVQVKGIGDKMLEKLKLYIYVELPR